MALLELKDLRTHFTLDDGLVAKAVDGVSLKVERGRTLAVVGESGCGKSQTAFSIMRLLDRNGYHPSGSEILLDGESLLEKEETQMQRIRGNRMAMIFQEPMASLNPLYRVSSQLSEPLRQHQQMKRPAAYARCIELLQHVGIPDPESRVDNYPHEMSGGMKQRVMIAMALACRPDLLIADEPTTALDVTIQAQILALINDLQKETGMGILLITHDLGVVRHMADDVCVMYAGRIAEQGTRDEVFNNPQHPYTRLLLASIPRQTENNNRLLTIPGVVPSATDFIENGCRFCGRCPEQLPRCSERTPEKCDISPTGHSAWCHLLADDSTTARIGKQTAEVRPKKGEPGDALLSVNELTTHFPVKKGLLQRTVGWVRAVDGVSFALRRGETLALVGESGCGKTTVGQSILRLIDAARGEVEFNGVQVLDARKGGIKSLRRSMQIVFQDPFSSLSPRLRVGEIIGEGVAIHEPTLGREERRKRVRAVMEQVGLSWEVADRFPHEFSGGQRQRIAIARALILDPDIMVLDEPTSALDVSVQAQILNLLEEIQNKRGLAYLFITHDLGVVEYIADRVAVMYLGRIVEHAPTATLFHSPQHPYTRALLDAVPRIDDPPGTFNRIEGDVPSPLNPPAGCHFHPRCPAAVDLCREKYPMAQTIGEVNVACHLAGERPSSAG
ncbi:MAG: dipeptide ABC transporter ATP-binding protein [Kiritimatiellae bacterium]|nr:dipeptide ABC transporter ATP-binding protein [Kiritimatiellia bacterium]